MLKARLLFGLLMTAGALGILLGDAWLAPQLCPILAVGTAAVFAIAAQELTHLFRLLPVRVESWFAVLGTLTILFSNWLPRLFSSFTVTPNIALPCMVFVLCSLLALLLGMWRFDGPGTTVLSMSCHVFIFFYLGVLPSFLVQLRWQSGGEWAMLLAIFTAKGSDIGAYLTGRSVGRYKIAPRLSPGKTVEGSIGGLILAVIFAWAIVKLEELVTGASRLGTLGVLTFAIAVGLFAQLGDLIESLIKRDCRSKDASSNIPGFGGWLDVVDSLVFSAPVAYSLLLETGTRV